MIQRGHGWSKISLCCHQLSPPTFAIPAALDSICSESNFSILGRNILAPPAPSWSCFAALPVTRGSTSSPQDFSRAGQWQSCPFGDLAQAVDCHYLGSPRFTWQPQQVPLVEGEHTITHQLSSELESIYRNQFPRSPQRQDIIPSLVEVKDRSTVKKNWGGRVSPNRGYPERGNPSWTQWGHSHPELSSKGRPADRSSEIPVSGGVQMEASPWPRKNTEGLQSVWELLKTCMKTPVGHAYAYRHIHFSEKRIHGCHQIYNKDLKTKQSEHICLKVILRSHSDVRNRSSQTQYLWFFSQD